MRFFLEFREFIEARGQQVPTRTRITLRRVLVVAPLVAALAACLSFFIYPSPYSPLLVGGALPAGIILIACFRNPVWVLYAAVFVVFLPIGLIPPYIHSFLNRSVTALALVTWLFGIITRQRKLILPAATLLMLGFVVWSTVTLVWVGDLAWGAMILMGYVLRFGLFLLLIPNEIRSQKQVDGLMNTLALNGWILIVLGAATIILRGYVPGMRLKVLDMNENQVGILALVMMIGVLWQTVRPSKLQVLRSAMASIFVLMTIGLTIMSGSRGSAISLLLTLLILWFLRPTRRWGKVGLLVLMVGAMAAPFIFRSTFDRFAFQQEEMFLDRWQDTALGGREILWQAGWQLIEDHPLLGVGIGNSSFAVMPGLLEMKSDWEQDENMNYLIPDLASLHNPILVIWSETGFPGIVLYLGVLVSAFLSFKQKFRKVRNLNMGWLISYFAIVISVFLGYMTTWVKAGGAELDFMYFLLLSLLLIPSGLDFEESKMNGEIRIHPTDRFTPSTKVVGCN